MASMQGEWTPAEWYQYEQQQQQQPQAPPAPPPLFPPVPSWGNQGPGQPWMTGGFQYSAPSSAPSGPPSVNSVANPNHAAQYRGMSSLGVKRWSREQKSHDRVTTTPTDAREGAEKVQIPRAISAEVDAKVPEATKTIDVDIVDLIIPRMSKNKMKKERSKERKRAQAAKDEDDAAAMQESLEGKMVLQASKKRGSCVSRAELSSANVHAAKEEEKGIPTMITNCTLKISNGAH